MQSNLVNFFGGGNPRPLGMGQAYAINRSFMTNSVCCTLCSAEEGKLKVDNETFLQKMISYMDSIESAFGYLFENQPDKYPSANLGAAVLFIEYVREKLGCMSLSDHKENLERITLTLKTLTDKRIPSKEDLRLAREFANYVFTISYDEAFN